MFKLWFDLRNKIYCMIVCDFPIVILVNACINNRYLVDNDEYYFILYNMCSIFQYSYLMTENKMMSIIIIGNVR